MCCPILQRLRHEVLQDVGQGLEEGLEVGQLEGGCYAGDEARGQQMEGSHGAVGVVTGVEVRGGVVQS